MLLIISEWLREINGAFSFLRVLGYITVRCGLAIILAFSISLLIGGPLIRLLKRLGAGQRIRKSEGEDGEFEFG